MPCTMTSQHLHIKVLDVDRNDHGVDCLPKIVVRASYDRHVFHAAALEDDVLDLNGIYLAASNIDHLIPSAHKIKISVGIEISEVANRVVAGGFSKVSGAADVVRLTRRRRAHENLAYLTRSDVATGLIKDPDG